MRHLKTLGRATNLSSIKTHHVERHTGHEWRIHPYYTHAPKHSACLLWPRPNASLDPFALKTCSQHTARERAHLLDERATSRPIKMHHVERCPGPEWRAHAHARRNTPHACFGHMPKAWREPFAVIYGARNGTSHSARTRV